MLATFKKLVDSGGSLTGVTYAIWEGSIRAVELRFDSLVATFRAVDYDDTIEVSLEILQAEPDEVVLDASNFQPWSKCIGSGLLWIWRMTNQQDYDDGVRMEFSKPDEKFTVAVELIVAASQFHLSTTVNIPGLESRPPI